MYYLLYALFYLISLIPFWLMYGISDFLVMLVFYVFGYRKKVVLQNLKIAFPEKTDAERNAIAKKFYRNFIDTFLESIKMISMSDATFKKRVTIDYASSHDLVAKGKSIQYHSGHQMNWEFANWIVSKHTEIPFVGVYQAVKSKPFNRLMLKIRGRYGTKLVSTREFKNRMHDILKNQYCIGLAADQNVWPGNGNWLYFFSKPAPFVPGPEKGAVRNNTAVVFVAFEKPKRGYYHFSTKVIVENGADTAPGELTRIYRDMLEATIRETPDNYLWSHRRWRHDYLPEYKEKWIDNRPNPLD
ncbi:MAG: hypothetical protein RLY16_2721 [Bacteroidota bacterium]